MAIWRFALSKLRIRASMHIFFLPNSGGIFFFLGCRNILILFMSIFNEKKIGKPSESLKLSNN